jgi:chromosome segregation ATPase
MANHTAGTNKGDIAMSDQDTTDAAEETPVVDDATDEVAEQEQVVTLTADEHKALTDELNRLKRERADANKKAKDAEKAAKAAAAKQAAEDGDWKSLAEERELELAAAVKAAEEAQNTLVAYQRQKVVTEAASALDFRDPQDAHRFLNIEDQADPKLVEAALKRLKKDKPYLIAEPRRTGVDHGSGGGNGTGDPAKDHNSFIAQVFDRTAARQ